MNTFQTILRHQKCTEKKIANIKWNTIGHSATITSHATSPKAYTLPQRALYVENKHSCTERSKKCNFVNPAKTKEWYSAPKKYFILNPKSKPNKAKSTNRAQRHEETNTPKQTNKHWNSQNQNISYVRRPNSRPHKLRLRVTPAKYHFGFTNTFMKYVSHAKDNLFFQGFIFTNSWNSCGSIVRPCQASQSDPLPLRYGHL